MRGRKGKIINNDIIDDEEIWNKTPFRSSGAQQEGKKQLQSMSESL